MRHVAYHNGVLLTIYEALFHSLCGVCSRCYWLMLSEEISGKIFFAEIVVSHLCLDCFE